MDLSIFMYRMIGLILGLAVPFVFLWLKIVCLLAFLFVVYGELRKVQFPQSGIYFVAGMLAGSLITLFI